MPDETDSRPLWLDIKTEYIDENLDRVIPYLRDGSINTTRRDSFYKTTIELFEQRISDLLGKLASCPIYSKPESEERIGMDARMLGAFLLIHEEMDTKTEHAAIALLARLQLLVPTSSQSLSELALDIMSGALSLKRNDYPFNWKDFIEFTPQILSLKITSHPRTGETGSKESLIEKKGTMLIKGGHIDIATESMESRSFSSLVHSMEIFDGRIRFMTLKSNRLKQSDVDNIEKLEEFTRNFILDQKDICTRKKCLKTWAEGDHATVKVSRKYNGLLFLKTTDPEYETMEGILETEKNTFPYYYYTSDFVRILQTGDQIEAVVSDPYHHKFTVSEPFTQYIVDECVDKVDNVKAVIKRIKKDRADKEKAYLLTERGYPVQAFINREDVQFNEGDYVEVRFSCFGKNEYYGVVNVDIIGHTDPFEISEEEIRTELILSYRYESEEESRQESIQPVNEGQVKEICRMLTNCQNTFPSTAQRYRVLCAIRILCNLMSWNEDSKFIAFISDYLENLVKFAKGEYQNIRPMEADEGFAALDTVKRRIKIIGMLMVYGKSDKDGLLAETMAQDDVQLKKLAALIQSDCNIGQFLSPSMRNVVKREIVTTLSLEDDGESDLDIENGIYLGLENEHQEFKTSFFFAPQNAKEQKQKITIFKGICAFLNSRNGGTLYIGVDDMGYVKGVEHEIEQMEKTVFGNYHGIDGLVRYITDEAKRYFDLSILTHVTIQPMYDNNVIAIKVSPYEYNIVEIENTAYIRLNNETVVMNDATRRKILADRIIMNQDDAMVISRLQEAISNRRQAILHGYRSSNSGNIRDRHVEPFAFASGYDTVWCYEQESQICKVFKTDRISNMEVLKDTWQFPDRHKSLKMDIFRMTGETPIHVRLQLNLRARNILIEEYEEAEKALIPTDDSDVWYLDTDVYQLKGIGRFYIGLAKDIQIIDAPELEKYVKEYVREYIH